MDVSLLNWVSLSHGSWRKPVALPVTSSEPISGPHQLHLPHTGKKHMSHTRQGIWKIWNIHQTHWKFYVFFSSQHFERSQFDSLRLPHVSGNRWWWQSYRIFRLITKKLTEIFFGPEPKIGQLKPSQKKLATICNTWDLCEVVDSRFIWELHVEKSMEKGQYLHYPALTF